MIARLLQAGQSKATKKFCLEPTEILAICSIARNLFLSQPVLLELNAPVHIVGDIHGQYTDLLRIFELSGYPSTTNYLFLGDYVDRGKQSLETILLLLCYKLKYPETFFLLRGNHECANISRIYGFHDECKRRSSIKVWKTFTDVFNCLPIAAVVAEKIFCVHGGLSPNLADMNDIRNIVRPTEIPGQGLLTDLLWSDPANIKDWGPNDDRGVSWTFGRKPVANFLRRHDLDLVCRSHMVVETGYEFFGERNLVTIFSAPNVSPLDFAVRHRLTCAKYCGEFDNWGAIMTVSDDLLCNFNVIKSPVLPSTNGRARRKSETKAWEKALTLKSTWAETILLLFKLSSVQAILILFPPTMEPPPQKELSSHGELSSQAELSPQDEPSQGKVSLQEEPLLNKESSSQDGPSNQEQPSPLEEPSSLKEPSTLEEPSHDKPSSHNEISPQEQSSRNATSTQEKSPTRKVPSPHKYPLGGEQNHIGLVRVAAKALSNHNIPMVEYGQQIQWRSKDPVVLMRVEWGIPDTLLPLAAQLLSDCGPEEVPPETGPFARNAKWEQAGVSYLLGGRSPLHLYPLSLFGFELKDTVEVIYTFDLTRTILTPKPHIYMKSMIHLLLNHPRGDIFRWRVIDDMLSFISFYLFNDEPLNTKEERWEERMESEEDFQKRVEIVVQEVTSWDWGCLNDMKIAETLIRHCEQVETLTKF
ncbi:unnamed protein product [Penicillium salamii]|nr:unnamed protein product [Penicillium salamii]CAG8426809.1 unnamed protein product [Penicillium salamii]